jgi:hypothetical protein
MDAFNKWAKGKALTRDVLIHTVHTNVMYDTGETQIAIVVYHPEDPFWDATQDKPIQRVLKTDAEISRLEREATGTAAEHEMVEQHIAGYQSAGEVQQ